MTSVVLEAEFLHVPCMAKVDGCNHDAVVKLPSMSLFSGNGLSAAQETEVDPTIQPDTEKPTTDTSDTSAPSTEEHQKLSAPSTEEHQKQTTEEHQKQTPEILYKVSRTIQATERERERENAVMCKWKRALLCSG